MADNTHRRRGPPESPKSSLKFQAQARMFELRQSHTNVQQTKSKNPFIEGLQHRLARSALSPNIMTDVKSPSHCTEFAWTIDDIAKIKPADIKSPMSDIDMHLEEHEENLAQAAISSFFETCHIPSPQDDVRSWKSFQSSTPPLTFPQEGCATISSTPCARERRTVITCDAGTQTCLSLPLVLPKEVEDVLKHYLLDKEDISEIEDCNSSSSTSRRKLFFHLEDELSPVRWNPPSNPSSKRHVWTPVSEKDFLSDHLSSPEISPIKAENQAESYESSMSCSVSNAQDMHMSCSLVQEEMVSGEDTATRDTGYHTSSLDEQQCIFTSTAFNINDLVAGNPQSTGH